MHFSVRMSTVGVMLVTIFLLAGTPAFAQIAPGVMQSAAHTANISGTVKSSIGAPVAGAEIRLTGTSVRSTKSNADGSFNFRSVPWGTYEITVTSSLGTASRAGISLNGDVDVAIQYQAPSQLRTIAHVSTSSAGAHINVTSSSIDSVTPSAYAFQGNGTWKQLFAQVPGVAASGYTNGGGDTELAIPGSPQAPVALSLNGALPYETSTTLDGMPLQGVSATVAFNYVGGGTDLSTLPLGAFETADIVRGPGANAPSIVDSIGGSFVLHGPEPTQRDHFELAIGNDPYGGVISNSRLALRIGKRLSATFIYGVNDSPGPLGTAVNAIGFDTPATINGQTVWFAGTGAFQTSHDGIFNCNCSFATPLIYCCAYQSTAWNAHNGAADFSYDVTPSITAEVFYAADGSKQVEQSGYWPVGFTPFPAAPPYGGSYAPSPPGQDNYRFPLAFGNDVLDVASNLLEEKVTAYIGSGVLRFGALQHNSFSSFHFAFPPNGEYTVWGTADVGATYPGTPTAYDGTRNQLTFFAIHENEGWWSNNRDLLGSYAVQLNAETSVGLSQTDSYYNMPWYFRYFFGKIQLASVGNAPDVSASTGETRMHVDFEPADTLSLGLSWYWTRSDYHLPLATNANRYTDMFFRYNAPRFGAVWRPGNNVAVRLAVGGGYALPALYDLSGSPPEFDGFAYLQYVSNYNLKPEEAFGYDLGTDVRLNYFTALSFDVYRTNLYGQFYNEASTLTYKGFPLYISESGNLAATRYEGVNLTVARNAPAGWYWRGTLGFTRGYVVNVPPGFYNGQGCTKCVNQTVIPGPNFNGSYIAAVPYAGASALLGYKWRPRTYFDLSPTYYGNNNIYYQRAFVELDGHASYAIGRNISLLATFRNITGVYDQSVQYINPGYANPVIQGAVGYWPGASLEVPYGPRAVIVTADYRY